MLAASRRPDAVKTRPSSSGCPYEGPAGGDGARVVAQKDGARFVACGCLAPQMDPRGARIEPCGPRYLLAGASRRHVLGRSPGSNEGFMLALPCGHLEFVVSSPCRVRSRSVEKRDAMTVLSGGRQSLVRLRSYRPWPGVARSLSPRPRSDPRRASPLSCASLFQAVRFRPDCRPGGRLWRDTRGRSSLGRGMTVSVAVRTDSKDQPSSSLGASGGRRKINR